MKPTNEDYCVNSYIKDELLYNYYKHINTDFLNNKLGLEGPYIQILSYYRNPILRICSQMEIYNSFNETTTEDSLFYLLDLYIHCLSKIKVIEIEFLPLLNPSIKRLIEIFYYSKEEDDPKFKSKEFLAHKRDFMDLLRLVSNMKNKNLTCEITSLIKKILTTNVTVNIFYKIEQTIKFYDDIETYYDYKQAFCKRQAMIRETVEEQDFNNETKIEIPPIEKSFNFNNLVLFNDDLIEDNIVVYTLFRIDIINIYDLKQNKNKNKKYKTFIALIELLKENDFSLTAIDPFMKKYSKQFCLFKDYINEVYNDKNSFYKKTVLFIPYCITHIIPKYELHRFIRNINPLLRIQKANIVLTDDNEIIELFNEPKKIPKKNKKKNKNNNIIDISNCSNEIIIEIYEPIEPIEDTKLEQEFESNENENIELETDDETDDDEGFQIISYKTNNNEFDYYDIVFNNIIFKNKNIIEILIFQLYETNHNFVELMKQYNIIRIIKDIHEDKFYLNKLLHFNSILINTKTGASTSPLHFYIENNVIINITQVINLI